VWNAPVPVEEHFVGRRDELGVLEWSLDEARAARPRVVLVHGPPGIGKSALLRRFLRRLDGARVLQASGDETELALGYGALSQFLVGLSPPLPVPLAALSASTAPSSDPLTAGAALVELLGALQDEGPVVLVLDDAQWADSPSLHALVFALRRLRVDRVLALLSARDDSLASLPPSLHRLLSGEIGIELGLGGLSPPELGELAASLGIDRLPAAAVERVAEHTDGNPLHTLALLAELPSSALLFEDLPAPRAFGGMVVARLASCSPDAEALVAAASVLGLRCPLGLAARVGRVAEPLVAIDVAVEAGLLETRATATTTIVAFTHPLVRAAVYHDLAPSRRAALHAVAAELVDDEGAALRHRVAATPGEDADLSRLVADYAAREAERGAWAAASAAFLAAARVSSTRTDRERHVIKAFDCLILAGDYGQAALLGEEMAAFSDSPLRRWALGQFAFVGGKLEEAERLFLDAWKVCDGSDDAALAGRIAASLAAVYVNRALGPETVAWARRALEAEPALRFSVVNPPWLLVVGLAASGCPEDGLALVSSLPEGDGEPDARRLEWLSGRGTVRMWTDDLRAARDDLSTVAEACIQRGPFQLGIVARFYLAETEYRLGHWDEAVVHGELAVSMARDSDQVWMMALVHAVAAFPLAGRGKWDRARFHTEAAADAAAALGPAADLTWAAVARARLAIARGRYEDAATALGPVADLAARGPALEEPGIQPWRTLYAEALVRLGRLDEAEAALTPLEALAAERERHSSLLAAARVRGSLEAARGRSREAQEAFEAGLVHAAAIDMPFERALLEDTYGRLLRRAGERRQARERLERAEQTYARLGAEPYLHDVSRELAACGLKPRRRSSGNQLELTPQELAVARLVAVGRTNREVAAELVVSPKTVEYHLAHVYVKTGVRSRTELAARMATGG